MANNTTVIDITARVNDQTSTGVNSARRNLSGLEQSIRSMQTTLSRVQSGQITVSAVLKDMASSGLRSITQTLALTGVTMGVADSVSTYMGYEQSLYYLYDFDTKRHHKHPKYIKN